jgi:hypothetical protein
MFFFIFYTTFLSLGQFHSLGQEAREEGYGIHLKDQAG